MRYKVKWRADGAGPWQPEAFDSFDTAKERVRKLLASYGSGTFIEVWNEDDVAAYRKRWPLGTRQRVWFELLLGTGLRRGDAVMAGPQHIKEGAITMATEKTGMVAYCEVSPGLAKILKRGPTSDLTFICGEKGEPLTKESFGNMFREACNLAGVKKSAHGLRKLAATMDADAGYSDRELEAKYAWTGGFMASLYTRTANRKRLAQAAARRLRKGKTP